MSTHPPFGESRAPAPAAAPVEQWIKVPGKLIEREVNSGKLRTCAPEPPGQPVVAPQKVTFTVTYPRPLEPVWIWVGSLASPADPVALADVLTDAQIDDAYYECLRSAPPHGPFSETYENEAQFIRRLVRTVIAASQSVPQGKK